MARCEQYGSLTRDLLENPHFLFTVNSEEGRKQQQRKVDFDWDCRQRNKNTWKIYERINLCLEQVLVFIS